MSWTLFAQIMILSTWAYLLLAALKKSGKGS